MSERNTTENIYPRNPKKSYALMELVKGQGFQTKKQPEDTVFVWPHLLYIELIAALVFLAGLLWVCTFKHAPLEDMASADTTPNPMKAPWYFLGLQELLVFFDPWLAGMVLPSLIVVGMIAIPYLDINPKGVGYWAWKERPFAIWTFQFGWVQWWVFIIIGVFFRGLDWAWYWPWDDWHQHKPSSGATLNDMNVILEGWGMSVSAANMSTYIMTIGYFAVFMVLPAILWRKFSRNLGFARYVTVWGLMALLWISPVKVFLRLGFNIKYFLVTPWFKV
ncbi:MAG: cytochrome B6 [Nitrospirota bacterium]|nr:cytochrome B6 [Nitrospirota bacterium]